MGAAIIVGRGTFGLKVAVREQDLAALGVDGEPSGTGSWGLYLCPCATCRNEQQRER
jgi:hypothetical protein